MRGRLSVYEQTYATQAGVTITAMSRSIRKLAKSYEVTPLTLARCAALDDDLMMEIEKEAGAKDD